MPETALENREMPVNGPQKPQEREEVLSGIYIPKGTLPSSERISGRPGEFVLEAEGGEFGLEERGGEDAVGGEGMEILVG